MYEFKLQIGCLLVVLYFLFAYIKGTTNANYKCHPLFDIIIGVAPWAIIFDGLTAWTVNHRDLVPTALNTVLHLLFFVLDEAITVVAFLYIIDKTHKLSKKSQILRWSLPGILSILGTCVTIGQLYYVDGNTTSYSMGVPVYITYASVLLHLFVIFIHTFIHNNAFEKAKHWQFMAFLLLILVILVIQSVFPETLISALYPMFLVMGMYVSIEDPFIRKLNHYNSEMVTSFATLVENRDDNTGGHIKRTTGYVNILLENMRKKPEYKNILTEDYVRNIVKAAPMHDIGKIATPDSILQKPGKLTDEEYAVIKLHSARGEAIINSTFSQFERPEYVKIAGEVARFHHEKWNGKGYPDGLSGEAIPLHARVMSVADVFDAVSAKRCYRDALPLEVCYKIIADGAGTDFDPAIVDIFFESKDAIEEFANANLYYHH